MNLIHVYTLLEDSFSFSKVSKIVTVSEDTFNKMVKGIGSTFSHFDKQQAIRYNYTVLEVRQAVATDYKKIN